MIELPEVLEENEDKEKEKEGEGKSKSKGGKKKGKKALVKSLPVMYMTASDAR